MVVRNWRRRTVIGSGIALVADSAARAQGFDPQKVFKDLGLSPELRNEIQALLPQRELDLARTVAALIAIERDADALGLKPTPLALNAGVENISSSDSLYTASVPRLVALIDRSEEADIAIADRAGELLARINASQRELADALKPDPLPPSRSHDFAVLKSEYASYFASATIRPQHAETTGWYLKAMLQFRTRYEKLSATTGVPWFFIGVAHALEASFNFRAHLHNGDFPLSQRTRQVPAGRPRTWLPPSDWEASARDALALLGFVGKTDWSLERTLYRLEAYNGFGYRRLGVPSPYLWCFSNHYDRGKYVADGKWNAQARSQQCGAAVMLKLLSNAGAIDFSATPKG